MDLAELIKLVAGLEGGKEIADNLTKATANLVSNEEVNSLKEELKTLQEQGTEKDSMIDSLKVDLEKAGGDISAVSADFQKRLEELEKVNQEKEARNKELEAEKERKEMIDYFVENLTPSLGQAMAKKEVKGLMYDGLLESKEGSYYFGDKSGKDAIDAIINNNKDFMQGSVGGGTTPLEGGGSQPRTVPTMEERLKKGFAQ